MANPSLAMIPSGYKDGTLYSPVPNTAIGDFDVSRGSLATRVNKNGLIEYVGYTVGGDLVTNGDFATDSDWTKGGQWTISGGKANYLNGTQSSLIQGSILSSSLFYRLDFTISGNTASLNFTDDLNAALIGLSQYAIGSHTLYFQQTASGTGIKIVGNVLNTFSIDNVSVIEFAGEDVPRIDYTDGGCPVLLTEPQSTNEIEYSEDFSNAYWTKTGATVVGGQASPSADSPLGAFKLVEDTSTAVHSMYVLSSASYTGTLTESVFLKASEITLAAVHFGNFSNRAEFNLSNGTVATFGVLDSATIEAFTNGWYKCTVTDTFSASNAYAQINLLKSSGGASYAGDGTSGVYIFGAQVEELPYATSYIPTSGGTATRLGDSVTGAGNASTFNDSEGVLFVETKGLTNGGEGDLYISIGDGSLNNAIQLLLHNTPDRIDFRVRAASALEVNISSLTINQNINNKIACLYSSGNFALWINGIERVSTAVGNLPSGLSELNFNTDSVGSSPFYGKTSQVQVFNTALTDAELAILTTI